MYFYEPSIEGFAVRDENRNTVAHVAVEADAREIVAALNLVSAMAEQFPGLRGDAKGETAELIEQEVDGPTWSTSSPGGSSGTRRDVSTRPARRSSPPC